MGLQVAADDSVQIIHSCAQSNDFTILNITSLGAEDLVTAPDSRFPVAFDSFVGSLLLPTIAATIAATIVTPIDRIRPHRPKERQSADRTPPDNAPGA